MNTESGTQAPGWYPDPDRADSLRYWDGSTWTDQRRDRPEWLAESTAAGAEGRPPRSMRRPLAIVIAIGVALTAFVWFTIPKRPDRSIDDRAFLAAAESACRRVVPDLRAERRSQKPLKDDQVADRIDEVAAKLDDMVAELRALPVAVADQAEVAGWLSAWNEYLEVGRRYADAIRAGDAEKAEKVRQQGDDEAEVIGRFASGNRIDACVPFSLA